MFRTCASQRAISEKDTSLMKPWVYAQSTWRDLVQQENVFGTLMKNKKLLRRFWKVFPNHEHYVRNCEMLHTCMFVKTMIFC